MSFAYQHQNDFLPAPATCTGSGVNTSSPRCAGSQSAVSFLMDYKPVPRADLYGGMMISNVYGGLASGFFKSQTSTDHRRASQILRRRPPAFMGCCQGSLCRSPPGRG
jgi:hypothetical protein